MGTMVMDGQAQQALLALALKYEVVTGKSLKWRKDTEVAYHMVLESLASGVQELFDAAVAFLELLSLSARREFLRLQMEVVPDGYEARVELYRGVAYRLLTPVGTSLPEGDAEEVVRTYRGVEYREKVKRNDVSEPDNKSPKRFYRGQSY
ncbi:hypothetical protein [Parathalassolituus penaei]|uniref:Uncharacterized protein n=1 Tax=Parathalassolituus penaei TaxID=2997323 RepID=A0A9X3EGY5_9GAMM|nr:hypothetical protein [Parathalassolituus penaei]MCY0966520.1 hypothetical protein [Parathalassolituus penaei]